MNAKGLREPNKLKNKLKAGEVCYGATITMSNPVVSEIMSHLEYDWLWFEMEHTVMSEESVLAMLQATNGSEVTTVVRVPWNDKTMIKRILDTGTDGILVPLIRTKSDAEDAVRAIKYPPLGERGAGVARAQCYGLHIDEYMSTANEEVLTILMIEHIDAVNNIEEILSVPGVDSVMIGALDLSGSMGILGQTNDPKLEEAIQKVLKASKKFGISCGIVAFDPKQAKERIKQGFTNIAAGMDVLFLSSAAKNILEQVKD
ncbi:MAG: aldolase/citrate lyase family protein [Lachnospiraceae bacterium]|nr:aldolase/citrate lyase family protein [Lachnospiraceae bacterium]